VEAKTAVTLSGTALSGMNVRTGDVFVVTLPTVRVAVAWRSKPKSV